MNLNIARTEPALARANGIELTYDTFGDAQAPPLLLIMGLAAQMIAWDDEFSRALPGPRDGEAEAAGSCRSRNVDAPGNRNIRVFRAVREAFSATTLIRPSVMFGKGDAFLIPIGRMLRRLPIFPLFGRGQTQLQPAYVEDVADAITRVMQNAQSPCAMSSVGRASTPTDRCSK